MGQAEFHCDEPFGVDNGELDGLSPQECFVLGYELCQVSLTAERYKREPWNDKISMTVHSDNKDRIERALNKREVRHKWEWPNDDVSESWVYLIMYSNEEN